MELLVGRRMADIYICTVSIAPISALERMGQLEKFNYVWPYPLNVTEDGSPTGLLPRLPSLLSLLLNCSHIALHIDSKSALPFSIL